VVTIDYTDYLMPAKEAELITKALMNAVKLDANFKASDREWFLGDPAVVSFRRVSPEQIKKREKDVPFHPEPTRMLR
jgi:hypothetical protein